MGRTLPSITQTFLTEQESLTRFRRALRREDQIALDDLLAASRRHLAAAAYASHLLPFEIMLLAMLVEEHKELMHLRTLVEATLPEETPPQQPGSDVDSAETRQDHEDSHPGRGDNPRPATNATTPRALP